jgi:Gpi18-like mannosyltransferase
MESTPDRPVALSTIICSYILSILMPFAGFFAGIYLLTKKQSGHGLTCIALSILCGLAMFWVFSNM